MRALILSGGGAKGAFTVGALTCLKREGLGTFDLISGTSTGSLIAALAGVGDYATLRRVYATVPDDDILLRQNIVHNLTNKRPFIFDTEPLRDMIDTHVTPLVYQTLAASHTRLCLTAIDLQTGRPTVFSTKPLASTNDYEAVLIDSHDLLKKALLASSSQAGFLPPVPIMVNGTTHQYVDGGNREVVPSRVVVDLVQGGTAKPDEVIMIGNNPLDLAAVNSAYTDLLKVLMRAIAIFIQDVRENDMRVLRAHCGAKGITLVEIMPMTDLDPDHPTGLRFKQALMTSWMRRGELIAQGRLKAVGLIA